MYFCESCGRKLNNSTGICVKCLTDQCDHDEELHNENDSCDPEYLVLDCIVCSCELKQWEAITCADCALKCTKCSHKLKQNESIICMDCTSFHFCSWCKKEFYYTGESNICNVCYERPDQIVFNDYIHFLRLDSESSSEESVDMVLSMRYNYDDDEDDSENLSSDN